MITASFTRGRAFLARLHSRFVYAVLRCRTWVGVVDAASVAARLAKSMNDMCEFKVQGKTWSALHLGASPVNTFSRNPETSFLGCAAKTVFT